ncbi:MAG: hypothetical protein R3C49_17590 [Planctomycetaceae bacterium]
MADVVYSADDQAWIGILETAFFDETPVYIQTSGSEDPPSQAQLRAVQLLESLGPEFQQTVEALLQEWVESEWEPDAQSDLEPEDFEFDVRSVRIPHIRSLATPYSLICISCELEPEHGVGIACRGENTFAVCHPELYQSLNVDDETSLNHPFDG